MDLNFSLHSAITHFYTLQVRLNAGRIVTFSSLLSEVEASGFEARSPGQLKETYRSRWSPYYRGQLKISLPSVMVSSKRAIPDKSDCHRCKERNASSAAPTITPETKAPFSCHKEHMREQFSRNSNMKILLPPGGN